MYFSVIGETAQKEMKKSGTFININIDNILTIQYDRGIRGES